MTDSLPPTLTPATMTDRLPAIFTNELLQDLRNKIDLLSQVAESLGMEPHQVLSMKLSVLDGIKFIENVLDKEEVPSVSSGAKRGREVVEEDQLMFESESSSRRIAAPPHALTTPVLNPLQPKQSLGQPQESMEARKLLVTSGCAISIILDLKLGKNEPLNNLDDVPPLFTIATVDLIVNHLPVLASLFKLGSKAYMIGGLKFPYGESLYLSNPINPLSSDLYRAMCWQKFLKGTSCVTYCLSYSGNGTLMAVADCDIRGMESPKIWPVVEEIDGDIHVFDSAPPVSASPSGEWIFSHEVLKHEQDVGFSWRKIQTLDEEEASVVECFIRHHLVAGRCIYAVDSDRAFLFDTKKKKEWEECGPVRSGRGMSAYNMETIWEIIRYGDARYVLEFGELYVVIALFDDHGIGPKGEKIGNPMVAAAYLVSSTTGKVVCSQFLYDFFKGPIVPINKISARIIKADEEGKTMCALVYGNACVNESWVIDDDDIYVFMYTFTVKELVDAALICGFDDFVQVDIIDKSIYKAQKQDGVFFARNTSFQALFL